MRLRLTALECSVLAVATALVVPAGHGMARIAGPPLSADGHASGAWASPAAGRVLVAVPLAWAAEMWAEHATSSVRAQITQTIIHALHVNRRFGDLWGTAVGRRGNVCTGVFALHTLRNCNAHPGDGLTLGRDDSVWFNEKFGHAIGEFVGKAR